MDNDLSQGLIIGANRHPGIRHLSKHFAYGHLPPHLQKISMRFAGLAQYLVDTLPDGPELTESLRKVWEAKNCAVLHAGFLSGQEVA